MFKQFLITSFFFMSAMGSASATTIMANDGQKIDVDISRSFPTRLIFEHDAGSKFIFNTVEGETADIDVTLGSSGDAFVSVIRGKVGDIVSGFLTTQAGHTYSVDFNIEEMRQEQVTITNAKASQLYQEAKQKSARDKNSKKEVVVWQRNSPHHQSLARLIQALYRHEVLKGFVQKRRNSEPVDLVGVVETWVHGFEAANITADTYKIFNHSGVDLYLEPIRKDIEGVLAFSASHTVLPPNATASLFIVRKKKDDK